MTFVQMFCAPPPIFFPSPYPLLSFREAEKILEDCEEGTYLVYHPVDSSQSTLRVAYIAQEKLTTASIYWNGQYQLSGKQRIYEATTPEQLLDQFPEIFVLNHQFIQKNIHRTPWYFGRQKAFQIEDTMAGCTENVRLVYFDTDVKSYLLAWKNQSDSLELFPIGVTKKGLSIRGHSYPTLQTLLENFEPKQKE